MNLKGFTDTYSSCSEEVVTDITKGTLRVLQAFKVPAEKGWAQILQKGPKEYIHLQFMLCRCGHRYFKMDLL